MDGHGVVQVPHLLQATVRCGLREEDALAVALYAHLPVRALYEPPRERVVPHQRLAERAPDGARGLALALALGRCRGAVAAAREHVERPHQVAQPRHAVDDGEPQRLRRGGPARPHQALRPPRHREPHFTYIYILCSITTIIYM